MARSASTFLAEQFETLWSDGSVVGLTDRQLLERFNAPRNPGAEAAFSALVRRHGPMVLGLCSKLLRDPHDAQDCFQAVFMVLARRAPSLREPDLLGNWLYGVSLRTARHAKARLARRRRKEGDNAMAAPEEIPSAQTPWSVPSAEEIVLARDQIEDLHREIENLPKSFRVAVVLRYFEGLTLDEIALRLDWPVGTVRSRLARARDKLRLALNRKGLVLPAGALGWTLSPRSASAFVPSGLCELTTAAAIKFAAGRASDATVSAAAAVLARAVVRTMVLRRTTLVVLTLLCSGTLAVGGGYLTRSLMPAAAREERHAFGQPRAQIAGKPADDAPASGRMLLVGRVLDPQGKPVPGAAVAAYAWGKFRHRAPGILPGSMVSIGDGNSDETGRFRLDAPRTSSSQYETVGAIAIAPGFGATWAELDPDAEKPTAEITLMPEQVIQGRLFDVQGRPAPLVEIGVSTLMRGAPANGGPPQDVDMVRFSWTDAKKRPAWPAPAITDADGRFALRGVGRGVRVSLAVDDPRFARQRIQLDTDGAPGPKELTRTLEPAQFIIGRVTYADTGKPAPRALLVVHASFESGRGLAPSEVRTDVDGRFRANTSPADHYIVTAYLPPDGQPYLELSREFDWPKGAVEHVVDLALPRGILLTGKVTEEGSGRPVAGARLSSVSHFERQNKTNIGSPTVDSAPDGSFQLAALPSPGYLSVMGPTDDYVFQAVDSGMVDAGRPGGSRYYSHANILLDLKPGVESTTVNLVLRRGRAVKGEIVDPDGKPVANAWMISRIILPLTPGPWKTWRRGHHAVARDGHFVIHGLDPNVETPVHFFEPTRKLAATALLSGKSAAAGPMVVRLTPCGTATMRLVDPRAKPVTALRGGPWLISMVVTPGATQGKAGETWADESDLTRIDPINYQRFPAPDADGVIKFPALIPGASYRVIDRTTIRDAIGPQVRKEFTVKPGQTIDLGEILIEK